MTEASNLARQFGDPARGRITNVLGDIAPCLQEIYVESSRAAKRAEFNRLGLTDCAILDALEPSHRLLTTDLDLYIAALSLGHQAENFNHLRDSQR